MNLLLISALLLLTPIVINAQTEQPFRTASRDLMTGRRIAYIEVELYRRNEKKSYANDEWILVASGVTDADGIPPPMVTDSQFPFGVYKLIYQTQKYYEAKNVTTFYPHMAIIFEKSTTDVITIVGSVSPYGYSFYKGVYAPK